jgi:type IV pilus assembly protein PilB
MSDAQHAHLQTALNCPWGLILVTGPTGSGKTVTLYSALQQLNQTHRNISTIEDPVEMTLSGINQVAHHEAIGLTFAKTLRAFLRQDPDVIMIGEIRDSTTAKIALDAAQTGHLILSTLHTNTALATLTRLVHLGIERHDIASACRLVIAQTLMRTLHRCKQPDHSAAAHSLTTTHDNAQIYQAHGCSACRGGYLGRTGVFETLPITTELQRMIASGATDVAMADHIEAQGLPSLRQSALNHVLASRSSIEELQRTTAALL